MKINYFNKEMTKTMNNSEKQKLKISVLIPGNISDKGFMQAGYNGYMKIAEMLPIEVKYISGVTETADDKALANALRELASENPDMIIAHGGQCDVPVESVSIEFPNIKFTVIQGHVKSSNVSSYLVRQQDSTWLAGALAGLMTKSNKIGHIAGVRPKSLLLERAAFYDGLKAVNPDAELLSCFTGNLDDPEINKSAAESIIEHGADIIYSVLNSGRSGVVDAVKSSEKKVYNIGNVYDWTLEDDSFIASAVADSSVALFKAASDLNFNKWKANDTVEIGLDHPEVVRLSMGVNVPEGVKEKITDFTKLFVEGGIDVPKEYGGKEFDLSTGELK